MDIFEAGMLICFGASWPAASRIKNVPDKKCRR